MFQPVGIKKLTNVAVVRHKTHGSRFEIACYKNTVLSYRRGHEKDLDNVLQSSEVYANVSKGVVARDEELVRAYGTTDRGKICEIILARGELQVSEGERKAESESAFRDAVTTLVEKCVNPGTNRPYPPGMIESALRDIHFSVDPKRSAKQQALEALPKLQEIFPIKRAEMRFAAVVPSAKEESLMAFVRENSGKVETNDLSASEASVTFTMDPSTYRALDKLVKECKGRLEVVTLAVTDETTTAGTFDQDTMKATAAKQTAMEKAEEALSKIEITPPRRPADGSNADEGDAVRDAQRERRKHLSPQRADRGPSRGTREPQGAFRGSRQVPTGVGGGITRERGLFYRRCSLLLSRWRTCENVRRGETKSNGGFKVIVTCKAALENLGFESTWVG